MDVYCVPFIPSIAGKYLQLNFKDLSYFKQVANKKKTISVKISFAFDLNDLKMKITYF